MLSNFEIVVRSLSKGIEVKLPDGDMYCLEDNELLVWTEPNWHVSYLSMTDFVHWCEELKEEDRMSLVFANTMHSLQERKNKIRLKVKEVDNDHL